MFPGGPSPVFRPLKSIASATLSTSTAGVSQSNRCVFRTGALVTYNGSSARVTFKPHTTNTVIINSAYLGMAGATIPNFDGSQAQIKVNSTGTFTLTGGGVNVQSDQFYFPYTTGSHLVVSFEISAITATASVAGLGTNYEEWTKNATGEASGTTASGYSVTTGTVYATTLVELA